MARKVWKTIARYQIDLKQIKLSTKQIDLKQIKLSTTNSVESSLIEFYYLVEFLVNIFFIGKKKI